MSLIGQTGPSEVKRKILIGSLNKMAALASKHCTKEISLPLQFFFTNFHESDLRHVNKCSTMSCWFPLFRLGLGQTSNLKSRRIHLNRRDKESTSFQLGTSSKRRTYFTSWLN